MSKKKPRIPLVDYIAYNNTSGARKFIVDFGQLPANNIHDLRYRMVKVMKEHGEPALRALAKIHPDRDLILEYRGATGQRSNGDYLYNNACGCENQACDGKCDCDCKKKKDKEHSNFNTNFRSDQDAIGNTTLMEMHNAEGRVTKQGQIQRNIGTALVVIAGVAVVVWAVNSGSRLI